MIENIQRRTRDDGPSGRSDRGPSGPEAGRRDRLTLAAFLLLLPIVAAACSDVTVRTTAPLLWQGALEPTSDAEDELFGSVVMAARGAQAEIVIEVNDGPPSAGLGWGVWAETCEDPTELIAPPNAFPLLETDASGRGFSEAFTGSGFVQDAEFAAAVFDNPDLSGAPLACADLVPAQP